MRAFLLSLLVIFLVIGCQQPQQLPEVPAAQQPEAQAEQPVPEPLPETDPATQVLLDNSKKITSYTYGIEVGTKVTLYNVKGTKVRIDLFEKAGKRAEEQYDRVYLDTVKKTALGICERDSCDSKYKRMYQVLDYTPYEIKEYPLDILKNIVFAKLEDRKRLIEENNAPLLSFQDNKGNTGAMWINNFYGFPYEITIKSPDGKETQKRYIRAVFNHLTDDDMSIDQSFTEAP